MPVVRPPPVAMHATVPAASSALNAPSSAAAAPVSPSARYTEADAAGSTPSCFATVVPSRPSGSGTDHARGVERGEVLADLAHRGKEHLLAEEARVVEISGGAFAVAPVAVEQGVRAGDPGGDRG